jgi:putative ABC transport system substrate-binding protein
MRNGIFLLALGLILYAESSAQAKRIHRVSALVADDHFIPAVEGFKKKMAEPGYVEGRNIRYDLHNPKGDGSAAVLLDKILKGAKPSELPIEQPVKLKLAVNLKTAKATGLKIPKDVLLRTDEVIE